MPAQGAEAQEHRAALRRPAQRQETHAGVRALRPGPEEVLRQPERRHRPADGQVVHVPAAAGPRLLPQPQRAAQGSEAPESAHQQERGAEAGRFRAGAGVRDPRQVLLRRGRDPVVPAARCAVRGQTVHHVD